MYVKKKILDFSKSNMFALGLGSTWVLLISGGCIFSLKYFKNFDYRHPYIVDTIKIAKLHLNCTNNDEIKIIKKKGNVDSSNQRAKCEILLSLKGEQFWVNINSINCQKIKNNNNDMDDDDIDISDYIENPYLIKKSIKSFFYQIKSFIVPFISSNNQVKENNSYDDKNSYSEIYTASQNKKGNIVDKDKETIRIIQEQYPWKINNIIIVKKKKNTTTNEYISNCVIKNVEHGDDKKVDKKNDIPIVNLFYNFKSFINNLFDYNYEIYPIYGNPEENTYYYKYVNKNRAFNKTQKHIGKIMLCAFCLSTMLAIKRIRIYKNSYSGLNYVKNFVLNNKQLFQILGDTQIQILSISGLYKQNYVNSKIYFQTSQKNGIVQLTATKNENDKTFTLLHAKLLLKNDVIELKKDNR
ncbi:conserved Plasmodium protein, unknown function [Plasmodium chabaudi chabaudi]|uniref:Uncharacterized protein n=1 Tax=Plasmodium chabaudi chabaudi TaxID=31271 RepID=A0A1D3S0J6_PLACU|nr:conserved Plasmodium protein, unknown function [Plasmodium chabaudi chabaudi]